jgi:trk system potassium uptake protein TrkH
MTVYARQFITDWGSLALVGLILAMGLGGCICSTAGGIKMLRLGLSYKALREDIKRLLLPENAVVVQKFHHIRDAFLSDAQVRSAMTISLLYIFIYFAGALIGVFYGYPFLESLFESTSAAANVGLSCGITNAGMPTALKLTYILQMWAGRLEFMAVFALAGFFLAFFRGKR